MTAGRLALTLIRTLALTPTQAISEERHGGWQMTQRLAELTYDAKAVGTRLLAVRERIEKKV